MTDASFIDKNQHPWSAHHLPADPLQLPQLPDVSLKPSPHLIISK